MSLLMKWLENLAYEVEVADHCLRKISPLSTCTRCKEECPLEAISYKNSIVEIATNGCHTCGICITVCPVQALKGQSPQRKVVNHTLLVNSPLPTVKELLYLNKRGIKSLWLEDEAFREVMTNVMNDVNTIIRSVNGSELTLVDRIENSEANEIPLSRRDFLERVKQKSTKTALSSVTPISWRFNHEKFDITKLYEEWAFFDIQIDQTTCTLCEACFTLCPQMVFVIEDEHLTIDIGECNGCNLCIDLCIHQAVQVTPAVKQKITHSLGIEVSSCQSCGNHFYSWRHEQDCYSCKKSKENSIVNFL